MKPSLFLNAGLLAASLALVAGPPASRGSAPPADDTVPPTSEESLRWWREARFGLFIHWGPVSLKGTEIGWSRGDPVPVEEYDGLYRRFNPTNFNAVAWARAARDSGARYLVLTSKHHDGFCLWDSPSTDYNIVHTPFGRDVVRELAAACRREDIRFCLYHSICDWRHPDYPLGSPGGKSRKAAPDMDRYNRYLKDQVAELILNYGPLGLIWFDGEWEEPWTAARGIDLYRHCRRLQPSILINNRVGKGRRDMEGTTAAGAFAGDFDTPEQRVGNFETNRPWESCITLGRQWSWKPGEPIKSLKECVETLVRTAGGGGNLLLNVGPMPGGEIEPRQLARLEELGRWLGENGRSIYGTRGGPFKPGAWGATTHTGDTLFVHVLNWQGGDSIRLPAPGRPITNAAVLGGGTLEWTNTGDELTLRVPRSDQKNLDTIVVLQLGSAR